MKSTEELKAEHEGILLGLRILEEICGRLERGRKVEAAHLDGMAAFIKEFADRCHHAKEETVLFAELEKAGMPREGGPVGAMLREHEAGRACVRGLDEGIAAYRAGRPAARLVENARTYIDLLRSHIDKENNVLYPMAERLLAPGTDKSMLERFERIEKERVGEGRHEEFHRMLEKLEKEYLEEGK
ncbi:MAG: hemerythrin domain-containing protein [Elusimicrobia bacterium]|nr:hemerythrin domain-containing protein [Elusimicrobiota bacterium]